MIAIFVVCDDLISQSHRIEWYRSDYMKEGCILVDSCFERGRQLWYRLKDKEGEEVLIKWLNSENLVDTVMKYKDSIRLVEIDLLCGTSDMLDTVISIIGKGRVCLLNNTKPYETGYTIFVLIECLAKIKSVYGDLKVFISDYSTIKESKMCCIEKLEFENSVLNILKGF